MLSRSFLRSLSVVGVSGLVLLGAGCGRGTTPATPGAGTGAPSGSGAVMTGGGSGEAGSGSAMVARGSCDNLFYPLRQGYEIRYRSTFPAIAGVSSGGYSLKVTDAERNAVTLRASFDPSSPGDAPITSDQRIECEGGILRAKSYLDLGSRISGGAAANQFKATTRNSSGEFLPADLRVGSEWRSTFDVRMEAVSPGADSPLSGPIDLNVTINRRAVAEETVTVPAGTYRALKIEATTDLGMGTPLRGTEWWAENVGMVKSTYSLDTGPQNFITEATSVTVPR